MRKGLVKEIVGDWIVRIHEMTCQLVFCATTQVWILQGFWVYKCTILHGSQIYAERLPKLGSALQVSPCLHLMHLIWCLNKRDIVIHRSVMVSKGHMNVIRKYLSNLFELEVTLLINTFSLYLLCFMWCLFFCLLLRLIFVESINIFSHLSLSCFSKALKQ